MKTFYPLLLSFLISFSLQGQWTQQTSNTNFNLRDVFFTSDNVGVAVGENGRVITTSNGGANWVENTPLPGCNLESVWFATPDSGWTAGTCGIHVTADGGQTWTLQTDAQGTPLHEVHFYNSSLGWAVGDNLTILRTTDGGANWAMDTLQNSVVPNNPLLAVFFTSPSTGWVGGGEKLHFTNDGGHTWTQGTSFLIDWIHCLWFVNANIGVGTGMGGSTTNTFDGGSNWQFSGSVTPNNENMNGVCFASDDSACVVGNDGLIYVSINGGGSWTQAASPVTENLHGVHFTSPAIGYVVGDNGTIVKWGNTVGIQPVPAATQLQLFPNPVVDGEVRVELGRADLNGAQYLVMDAAGRRFQILVAQVTRNGDLVRLKLPGVAPGFYTLEVITNSQRHLGKFIVRQ